MPDILLVMIVLLYISWPMLVFLSCAFLFGGWHPIKDGFWPMAGLIGQPVLYFFALTWQPVGFNQEPLFSFANVPPKLGMTCAEGKGCSFFGDNYELVIAFLFLLVTTFVGILLHYYGADSTPFRRGLRK